MNVGIVTTWFERGAAYVSRAYMEALSKEHQVFIFARGGEKTGAGDPAWDKPNVTWAKRNVQDPLSTYVDPKAFTRWVTEHNIDVVIFNEQQRWEIILYALTRMNIKIGGYVDYYTDETVPFFRLYDFLLCNTKRHYEVFKKHPQCLYIPWGTDLSVFKPQPRGDRKGIVFFHSSGISPDRKGTDILIEAFRMVEGDAKLIIHSQIPMADSPLFEESLRNDPRIQVIDKEVSAPGLYHLGDVYVYPTRLEGIGLSVPEALASGLPVIITDAPPMNEFVVDGVNGSLVAVESTMKRMDNYYWPMSICSIQHLADAMNRYVGRASEIEALRKSAREYAERYLDWGRNASELSGLISNIRSEKSELPSGLINDVLRYESSHIEYTMLEPLRRVAAKLGIAGFLRRLLRSGIINVNFSWLIRLFNRIPSAK